jgi:hypothetical protein
MMEAVHISEMLVYYNETTWHNILEGSIHHIRLHENLKSHVTKIFLIVHNNVMQTAVLKYSLSLFTLIDYPDFTVNQHQDLFMIRNCYSLNSKSLQENISAAGMTGVAGDKDDEDIADISENSLEKIKMTVVSVCRKGTKCGTWKTEDPGQYVLCVKRDRIQRVAHRMSVLSNMNNCAVF